MNYRGHKKKKAKSKGALEKVPEGTALEKADGTIRRGRRAKHGQVEVLMEESPLEKGQKTKNQDGSGNKEPKAPKKEEPAAQSLEKDTKATKKEEPAAQSLEKDIKKEKPAAQSLEKDSTKEKPATGSLGKDPALGKPASKSAPKAKLVPAMSLKKGTKTAICVDCQRRTPRPPGSCARTAKRST